MVATDPLKQMFQGSPASRLLALPPGPTFLTILQAASFLDNSHFCLCWSLLGSDVCNQGIACRKDLGRGAWPSWALPASASS